ncbi:MAG: hypothetical protein R3356_09775, partial [Eudoraea sp.]|nr:hypothetical protein [Eudoraea sp.]
MKYFTTMVCFFTFFVMNAQNEGIKELPYSEIPEYPDTYTAGSVVSRMIDGLGFRYYWATEELREVDLAYRPGDDSRSADETLDHILGLSRVILNSALKKPNDRSQGSEEILSFEEKRSQTLNNLRKASRIFLESDNLDEHPVIFISRDGERQFPFWNQ